MSVKWEAKTRIISNFNPKVVAFTFKRSKYGDLTEKRLVFWKSDRWGVEVAIGGSTVFNNLEFALTHSTSRSVFPYRIGVGVFVFAEGAEEKPRIRRKTHHGKASTELTPRNNTPMLTSRGFELGHARRALSPLPHCFFSHIDILLL